MTTTKITIEQLMDSSGVGFGTSGARGLVTAMTDRVCYAYTIGFLQYLSNIGQLKTGSEIAIAGDLRPSSPRIMRVIGAAITDQGYATLNGGMIPSPAIAAFGLARKIPSMMVTGSHIPDDRNGIKFNRCDGEILKDDEAGIRQQQVVIPENRFDSQSNFLATETYHLPAADNRARNEYIKRYVNFFPQQCLRDRTIGLYQHSTVGREIFADILEALGAKVIRLGFSNTFIPVDTEAVRAEDIELAARWAKEHSFDAIVSADGDADRPLIGDEHGKWLRGDIAGILCARYLGATVVATPVSSNSAVEKSNYFRNVLRTRIGSPFVIAAMQLALTDKRAIVVGYEANGGFLTASDINIDGRILTALPTRDAILVALTILMLAQKKGGAISKLTGELPQRFTASDRVKEFPTALSQSKIASLCQGTEKIEEIFGPLFGTVKVTDQTDGLRITFTNEEVVHLRPSGNAPEFRCYNEAATEERALEMNKRCMKIINTWKGSR
jgi:phosphomannomutase